MLLARGRGGVTSRGISKRGGASGSQDSEEGGDCDFQHSPDENRKNGWRVRGKDEGRCYLIVRSFQSCDKEGRINGHQFHKIMLTELKLYVNHKVCSLESA